MPPKDAGIVIPKTDPIVVKARQFVEMFPTVWVGVNDAGDNIRSHPQFGEAGKSNRCGLLKTNQLVVTIPWKDSDNALATQLSGQGLWHPTKNSQGRWLRVWIPEGSEQIRKNNAEFPCKPLAGSEPNTYFVHISAAQQAG